MKQVGHELGVRYVLEGSLRKSGNRIRATAQLVEADTGRHVWAERYDRDLADIFALEDEITEAVTIAVAPAIAEIEQQRAMRRPPDNLDTWAAYQRGLWHFCKMSAADNALAQKFFQQAIDCGPTFGGGYKGVAMALLQGTTAFQTRRPPEVQSLSEELARRAVALDGADAEARSCLGWALWRRGDYDGALAEAERALAMAPNLAFAHGVRGSVLMCSGRPKDGLASLERSTRLDPRGPNSAVRLHQVALCYYFSREYEAAAEAARSAIRSYPGDPLPRRWLAAALGQLGRTKEAKEVLGKAISMAPTFFERYARDRLPWVRPEDHAHILDGWRKAGWREG